MVNVIELTFNEDTGSELVETALCAPVLFAMIFGIVYFSLALYADHFVANAAKEAARYAVVHGSTWSGSSCQSASTFNCDATDTDVSNFVIAQLPPGLSSSQLSVSTSWPGTTNAGTACDTLNGNNSPNCLVTVHVNYSFSLPLPFVNQGVVPFTSSAQMSIVQ